MENQMLLCDKDLLLMVLMLKTTQNAWRGTIQVTALSLTRNTHVRDQLADVKVGYKAVPCMRYSGNKQNSQSLFC